MFSKKVVSLILSVLLTLGIALFGIFLNAQLPVLQNGGVLSDADSGRGVALTGWEQTAPEEWSFTFQPASGAETLMLCLSRHGELLSPHSLSPASSGAELYELPVQAGQPVTLLLRAPRVPAAYLLQPECAAKSFAFRADLQLLTLTAFATMIAVVLALFYYKRQRELRVLLLYLSVMLGWGIVVMLFPSSRYGSYQLVLRLFFSFAVLSPLLFSAALTGVGRPASGKPAPWSVALVLLFLPLSICPFQPLRVLVLTCGMLACMALLTHAIGQGMEAVGLLLYPCAVTTGLRIWALLPSLDAPFYRESFPFYLLRCARFFDLPFAFGCMIFVCRRFALQFDRTEQLAQELDRRVTERTRALTEETEARKSMMLNIFHDLRSPLFAVSSGLDSLEHTPQALPTLLPALQQRVAFVRRLTEDLFLAAKLEQKQILLNEDRVLLNREAAAVCTACRSEADKKGVALLADTAAPLPVWGDCVRLQQILQNLITNAIHYTPTGGQIRVECRAQDDAALVSVEDTGCGIAPQDQAAVFDRYFHTAGGVKHDSTGLGLTIAQELARLHHGEITLQSKVGVGSRFTLRLPLLK